VNEARTARGEKTINSLLTKLLSRRFVLRLSERRQYKLDQEFFRGLELVVHKGNSSHLEAVEDPRLRITSKCGLAG